MPIDVLMPQLSPTMTEGRLARWTRAVGDKVSAGDVLAEVETDKATMEVEAAEDGIIHAIIGEIGTDLPVGAPIAVLKKKDEQVPADYKPKGKAAAPAPAETAPAAAAPVVVAAPAPVMAAAVLPQINVNTAVVAAPVAAGGRVKASPLAKRVALQRGIQLGGVHGSGPGGRIVLADLDKAPAGGSSRTVVRRPDSVVKLTPMRKSIAARLTASKQTVPHFYLQASVQMDSLMAIREQMNSHYADHTAEGQKPLKLTVNDFIVKACGLALADYPAANAAWNGDSIVQFGNVDISVAVSIEGGLITPIVANADAKTLPQVSAEVKQLAADARAGKLKPAQYEGGSFSVSNLGMYGVDTFSAIVNPPQAAILAVGATTERAVSEDGEIFTANVMDITLSVDHRVIDGALGAELLGAIRHYLENPVLLVMA